MACTQGSRSGEAARSQALRYASIALFAACRCAPSGAGPPTRACVRVRPAALGRRDLDSECPFRVGSAWPVDRAADVRLALSAEQRREIVGDCSGEGPRSSSCRATSAVLWNRSFGEAVSGRSDDGNWPTPGLRCSASKLNLATRDAATRRSASWRWRGFRLPATCGRLGSQKIGLPVTGLRVQPPPAEGGSKTRVLRSSRLRSRRAGLRPAQTVRLMSASVCWDWPW